MQQNSVTPKDVKMSQDQSFYFINCLFSHISPISITQFDTIEIKQNLFTKCNEGRAIFIESDRSNTTVLIQMNCFSLCSTNVDKGAGDTYDLNGYLVSIESSKGKSFTDSLTFTQNIQESDTEVKYIFRSYALDVEYSNSNTTRNIASLSTGTILKPFSDLRRVSYNIFDANRASYTMLYLYSNLLPIQFKYQLFIKNNISGEEFSNTVLYFDENKDDIDCSFCSFWRNVRKIDIMMYRSLNGSVFIHDCTFSETPILSGDKVNLQNHSIRYPFVVNGNAFETGNCIQRYPVSCRIDDGKGNRKIRTKIVFLIEVLLEESADLKANKSKSSGSEREHLAIRPIFEGGKIITFYIFYIFV